MSGYLKKPIEDLRINWKLSTTQVKINGLTGMVGLTVYIQTCSVCCRIILVLLNVVPVLK